MIFMLYLKLNKVDCISFIFVLQRLIVFIYLILKKIMNFLSEEIQVFNWDKDIGNYGML